VNCEFITTDKTNVLQCTVCNRPMQSKYPPCKTHRMCKTEGVTQAKPSLFQQLKAGLLGDVTEAILSGVGLTKERWQEIIGGPCGCGERQQWLNKVGQALKHHLQG